MPARDRPVVRLAVATLIVNLFVILWGAWVRASGSGAGCGNHWPTCNGEVIPTAPGAHTLVEFIHRASSGAALVMVIAMVLLAWQRLPRGQWARRAAVAALVLLFVEAGIGAALVKFDLVASNASLARPLVLGIHLVNTQLLLSAIMLTAWWASGRSVIAVDTLRQRGWWFAGAFGVLMLIGMAGVFASLGDTLYPASSLAKGLAADRATTSGVLVHVRVWHPILAILGGCGLLWLATQAAHWSVDPMSERASRAVVTMVVIQWIVGVASLILLVPIPLQLLHLLTADLVWLSVVWLAAAALGTPGDQWERITLATSPAASASNTVPAPSSR